MKTIFREILVLLLIVSGVLNARAQINTTAGSVTSCPGEIQIPVNVTNCNGVGAISLVLNFNTGNLSYLGYTNLNPALTSGLLIINSTGDKVVISWANTTAANIGNSTLVSLRFTAVTGTSGLNWDTQTPGNCEYSDVLGNLLSSTYTNGTATINQSPAISIQPVSKTALVGDNMNFSFSATGTGINYLWQISTNGGSTWTDLVNNSTYSGVLTPTLYIYNVALSYNGYKYRCRLTGTCAPVVYTDIVTLTVVNPITTTLPTASFCPGNIIIPVTVTNFANVAAFSLTFSYNASVLNYTGYQSLNGALAPGLLSINASGGMIYITWSHTAAVTFGNGTLIELLFSASTGNSPLTWDVASEGACEFSALNGTLYTGVFINGNETIYGLPTVTSHPADKIIAKTQNTSFSITATGSGLSYRWQLSTNNGVSYSDLTDNSTYSNTAGTTLYITNAQLAMSGYYFRCKVSGTCTPVAFSNGAKLTVLPNIFTTCQTVTNCPGQVIVPILVTDFIGVGSFSLTLNYNPAILTFTGSQNLHGSLAGGSFVSNASGGKVYLTWSHTSAATIPNGNTLVELKFNGIPGSSSLTWDTQTPGNCEFTDLTGLVIFSTYTNGAANINSPPNVTVNPVNKTIYAGGSTTFGISATGTGLSYVWQSSANGGVSWADLSNTSPYSGVFTQTLTVNPAATGLNGYLYRCIVSGTCTPRDTSGAAMITVTQAAITTTTGAISNSCTGNISIPVSVTSCNNVASISLTLVFDSSKMSFRGYHSAHAALSGGILSVNSTGNKVFMTWASATAINPGTATLIQFRFRTQAGISTSVSWDTQTTGACEYADPNGIIITSFYAGSSISIQTNALIVNAGPDQTISGSSVQLAGSASGGVTPYAYLWSPGATLSSTTIPNPIASPTETTTYTLTVTGNNGCVGSDVVVITVNAIPNDLVLQNIIIPSGPGDCFDAYQTITVAGSGTYFTVQNGGHASLVAGQRIRFLAGTSVQPGGYMHAWITTNGIFCNGSSAPEVVAATGELSGKPESGELFSLYPNPSSGIIHLKVNDNRLVKNAAITVFNSMGSMIPVNADLSEGDLRLSLSGLPSGIYFIRVTDGNVSQTKKLIKL